MKWEINKSKWKQNINKHHLYASFCGVGHQMVEMNKNLMKMKESKISILLSHLYLMDSILSAWSMELHFQAAATEVSMCPTLFVKWYNMDSRDRDTKLDR